MGIITCVNSNPELVMPINIPRRKVINKDIIAAGSLISCLDNCKPCHDSPLLDLQIKELKKPSITLTEFKSLDLFCSFSSSFVTNPPICQGFM